MSQQAREYGAAIVGSVTGTFLLAGIAFVAVKVGLGWLASQLSLGLEVVLPAALLIGLCSWAGAVWGCWLGLRRVNAAAIAQTVYVQAGLIVVCYAALIGMRDRANLLISWAFLVALSALLSRWIALWSDRSRQSSR